ncbi:hypothetical protein ACLIJR_04205 [Hydrogenophaga sp. XSHU_21]
MSADTENQLNPGGATFRDTRFRLGVIASAIWLVFMVGLAIWKSDGLAELDLNQWGDFFAGAFAPLAFLWLILGYLQQGEELRMSTRALELQARELKESADQQRQLVEVTRQQVEGEREALLHERAQRERELSPSLTVTGTGGIFGGPTCEYNLEILNTGREATGVVVCLLEPNGNLQRLYSVPLLDRGKLAQFAYRTGRTSFSDGPLLVIEYRNVASDFIRKTFKISRDEGTRSASLEFEALD